MKKEEEKYLEFPSAYPGWEEEKAICKLLNRPLKRAERLGMKGSQLEKFWAWIQKIHDTRTGREEDKIFFDGGGIELNREGRMAINFLYSCRERLIFFEFCEGAPLEALKPILEFARKFKYSVFNAKETELAIEGKQKDVFDYASEKFLPWSYGFFIKAKFEKQNGDLSLQIGKFFGRG